MRKIRRLRRKRNRKQTHLVIGMTLALLFVFTAGYAAFGTNISITAKGNLTTEATCTLNHEWTYDYKNEAQEFKVPCTGTYKIELWGASGAGTSVSTNIISQGNGGYVSGNIKIKRREMLYLYVGNSGNRSTFSFNGGGAGEAPGGGSTDIRLINGNWGDFNSLKTRIMVAAGGGGGFYKPNTSNHKPGHAGGLNGYDADADYSYIPVQSPLFEKGFSGSGATQTNFGVSGSSISQTAPSYIALEYHAVNADFGYGGYGVDRNYTHYSSGGGSGYYGGGHGVHPGSTWPGGGGGSSFISGHDGCNAIDKNSTENNIIHTGQSVHYSGYKFTDTVMIDGTGCRWTTQKTSDCSGMPTHDGTGTMTGNSSNGYAKITLISIG